MPSSPFHRLPAASLRYPNAYPPNSYKSVTVWYLSLHTYLLVTLIVIQLVLLWRHSRRRPQAKLRLVRESMPPLDTTRKSPWLPKIRMAWRDPNQAMRENLQAPALGGTFRLEIDFNERGVQQRPPPTSQVGTAELRSLRFGGDGHLAPIQELEACRVLMPGSQTRVHPRLRGGSLSPNSTNTYTNPRNGDIPVANTDSLDYVHQLAAYFTIEELIEAVVAQFDELQRHRDGSLLRDALTGNERRRLVWLYGQLTRRLELHMRNLRFETEGVEAGGLVEGGGEVVQPGRREEQQHPELGSK